MTAQRKINIIHAACLIATIVTLMINFNAILLLVGITLGWWLWLIGVSLSLHKWNCYASWQPRSHSIELLLLYLSTLCCLESHISWAGGHKIHHRQSDQADDPFSPTGKSLLGKLKLGLYYHADPCARFKLRQWRDKPAHRWFHRNYFNVLTITALVMLLFCGKHFAYFVCVPALYVLAGYFWITVIAHHHGQTHDHSAAEFLFPGEGHHAAHHQHPRIATPGQFDLSTLFIRLLGRHAT